MGAAAGFGVYEWIGSRDIVGRQPKPFRKAFETNAKLSRAAFDDRALAPTYSVNRAEDLRVNGVYGLKEALAPQKLATTVGWYASECEEFSPIRE